MRPESYLATTKAQVTDNSRRYLVKEAKLAMTGGSSHEFETTSRGVKWKPLEQGGFLVHVPAEVISSADLKHALESVVSGQYEVQV